MNILSIGNSFSQDAQRYLHQIAKADGVDIQCFNLYIGGCSLSRHHRNMLSEEKAYSLEMYGYSTGFHVSLKEALLNRNWDVVTLQQVSSESPRYSTYQPYLENLAAYVRRLVPKAKLVIHQTWAYEQGSDRLTKTMGYSDCRDMLRDIKASYQKAAEDCKADFLIPSGEVFGELVESGVQKIHRDTYHASLGLGWYALGLTWYRFLTGKEIAQNTFADFYEEVPTEEIAIAKKCVETVAQRYGK